MSLKEEKEQTMEEARKLVKKVFRPLIPIHVFCILTAIFLIIVSVYIITDSINCGYFTVKDILSISALFISFSALIAYSTIYQILDYISIKDTKGYFIKEKEIFIYKKGRFIRIKLKDEKNHTIKLISVVDITKKTPLNVLCENKGEFFYTGGWFKYLLFYEINGTVYTTFYNTLSMKYFYDSE